MFQSVSNCTPNSRITVSFVATKDELLVINDPNFAVSVLVYVNSAQAITQPIAVVTNDTVTVELDTPAAGLHKFVNYSLSGIEHSFAVVSKDDYRPKVKPNDAPRRWFNYFPKSVRTTFYDEFASQTDLPLGRTINYVDIDRAHIVLDHIKDRVNFYYFNKELITSVRLPSGPVEYVKSTYTDDVGDSRIELLVLCVNKVLYRIRFNNRFSPSGEFFPTVTFIRSLEEIWYEADLPTGESFIDARRNSLRQRINPPMTALDTYGSLIWAAGYDTVYVMNKNFDVLNTILIGTESIVNIVCYDGATAYAVTRTGNIWRVQSNGFFNLVYSSPDPLGQPTRFDQVGQPTCILIPDPNNRRLLKVTGHSAPVLSDSWNLGDFAPAYARNFNNEIWVTGHDTNRVLRLRNKNDITEYSFREKVTIVSVEYKGDYPSILAVHYLKDYITLDLTGIRRTIPIPLETYKGPMSHIGTRPYRLVLLGAEGMPIYGAEGVTCWVNGIDGEKATTGDNLNISYKARSEGLHSVAFVLGNRAYDYKVEVASNAKKTDYFVPSAVAINRLDYSNANVIYTPTVGNVNSGSTAIPIDFKINFFGTYHNVVNVGTNGYITFGNSAPVNPITSIGSLGVSAIYVETGSDNGDLTQALPRSNATGTPTTKPLPSGKTPGVYYQTGVTGDDRFLRIAWVGYGEELYPDGNNISVATAVTNSNRLPVLFNDLVKASIGDYVTGNSISSPTTVTSKLTTTLRSFDAYNANGNTVYVYSYTDSVTQVDNYSEVIGYNKYVIANSKSVLSSGLPDGSNRNTVLTSDSIGITVNGSLNLSVTQYHAVKIPVLQPISTIYKTNIDSYNVFEDSITVLSNVANITEIVGNTTISGTKSFIVSNVDAVFFYIGQEVLTSNIAKFDNPTPWPKVTSKNANENGTYITITSDNTLEAGDIVTVRRTEILWSSADIPLAGRVQIGSEITYELSSLTLTSDALPLVGQNFDVRGYFIVLSKNVSALSGSVYNFKEERPVKEYTYEVGFYSGKRYQYIEVFYDNTNHQALNGTVVSSGAISRGNVVTGVTGNVNAGASYVFSSEVGTGQWANIGIGSFDFKTSNTSLKPKFVRVPSRLPTDSTVEFLVDQEFKTNSNVLISTTTGQLTVNGGLYRGQFFIKENDIIRLKVSYNKSSRAVAPIISIGDYQYPVPTIVSAAANLLVEHTFLTDNCQRNTILDYTFTIPAVDNYYVPDYYRSTSGIADYTYILTTGNVTANLTPGNTYSLTPSSQLTIKGILSSPALYDTKDIVIIGERNALIVSVRTDTPGLVDYLNFGNIDKPYTNNVEYITLPGNNIQVNNDVGYLSSNLILSTTANISSANLYINDLGASFVYNGSVTSDRWVPNLAINSNIGLRRDFIDYFQGDATVYQVYYDTYAVSNVYIPIGSWNVVNQTLNGPDFSPTSVFSGVPLTSYDIPSGSVVIPEAQIDSLYLNPFVYVSNPLELLKDRPYQFSSIKTENLVFVRPNYLNTKADRMVVPDNTRPSHFVFSIRSQAIKQLLVSLNRHVAGIGVRQTHLFVGRVTVNPVDIQYRYILAGGLAAKNQPYIEIPIGSIVGGGEQYFNYFEIQNAGGEWGTAATQDTVAHNGLKDNTFTTTTAGLSWIGNETTTHEVIEHKGLAEITTNYMVYEFNFIEDFVHTIFDWLQPGTLELQGTDQVKGKQGNDSIKTASYLTSSNGKSLIYNFVYWWFSWKNDFPYPQSEFPGLIKTDKYIPRTEFSNGNNFIFEEQTPEAYVGILAMYERMMTEFNLRNIQDFGKVFTEFVFNYGDLTYETYTELVFDVLKSYTSRPEEAYVPAPGFMYYKPIDKLFSFKAPYIIYNGSYEEFKKFLAPVVEETNLTSISFDFKFDNPPLLLLDLIPIFKIETVLLLPFTPIEDKIPITLIDLPPQLDQIPLIMVSMELMLDIVPQLLLPLEYSLLKEEVWEMDEIDIYGTYSTTINTWVDQGQYSDWWNVRRMPTDVTLYPKQFDLIKLYSKEYNYRPGGFLNDGAAEDEKVKYYNSVILPIPGTGYWNYRIYFKQRQFCVPKKGIIFPATWLVRGG